MENLIKELQYHKIHLSLEGDNIKLKSSNSEWPEHLIKEVRENKENLINYLKHTSKNSINKDLYIPVTLPDESYILSSEQQRMWLQSQQKGFENSYNIIEVVEFQGDIDHEILLNCFKILIERYEILRTVFLENGKGEVRQRINPSDDSLKFEYHNLCLLSDVDKNSEIESILNSALLIKFDLGTGPLFKITIVQTEDNKSLLCFVIHHIISDGWSINIMMKELMVLYQNLLLGKRNPLEPLNIHYKDYATWQQNRLNNNELINHKNYWKDKFQGELPYLNLPIDIPRNKVGFKKSATLTLEIENTIFDEFKSYCKNKGGTVYMGLVAVINILLYKYTAQDDIIIGSPIAGRDHKDLESQVGFFINTLALRISLNKNESFDSLFENVKRVTLEAYEHQTFPFDEIVRELDLKRSYGRNLLFDIMVVLQNTNQLRNDFVVENNQLKMSRFKWKEERPSTYDLIFEFKEANDCLELIVEYNKDIFFKETIERLSSHFKNLLFSLLKNPSTELSNVDYLKLEEKDQLLNSFNKTEALGGGATTILELFSRNAKAYSNSYAIFYKNKFLTYKELDIKSNKFCNFLSINYQVGKGDHIGISMDRTENMIIAILGILKLGGVYVPINSAYPEERQEFIQKDSNCKIVISDRIFKQYEKLELDISDSTVSPEIENDNLAYIIYTSGTTGMPKGVMIEHGSIVNTIVGLIKKFQITPSFKGLQFASSSFDASIWEIFLGLCSGSCLFIVDDEIKSNPVTLQSFLNDNQIDIALLPPSFIKHLNPECINLKVLVTGGEMADANLFAKFPDSCKYFNAYGPTEASICATVYHVDKKDNFYKNDMLIGKPISNTEIFILDSDNNIQPIGIIGEICIGGIGVGKGYINRPLLTAEKFVDNPFRLGQKMYHTGDYGRWLSDGNIEVIGRRDRQVKIRGYRIELDEIRTAILNLESVKDATIIVYQGANGSKDLVAFIIKSKDISDSKIISNLRQVLPLHMIPNRIISLKEFPTTSSGKINFEDLINMVGNDRNINNCYSPNSETEVKLLSIWKDILNQKEISIKDDFFLLGGQSIKVAQLANLIHQTFEIEIKIKDLFDHSILEDQARRIDAGRKMSFQHIVPSQIQESYAVSAAQRRMWFICQDPQTNKAYNICASYNVKGYLNYNILKDAFNLLIKRHESLRTNFKINVDGNLRQYIKSISDVDFNLNIIDLRNAGNENLLRNNINKEYTNGFSLEDDSLIKISVFKLKSGDILTCVLHHIISDGWSFEIMINEVTQIYSDLISGREIDLSPLKIQYKDFSENQNSHFTKNLFDDDKKYWLKQFEGPLPILQLNLSKNRPTIRTFNGGHIKKTLSKELTSKILEISKVLHGTTFSTLLTFVKILLHKHSQQDDIIVGTPVTGRDHADLNDQIGLFINTIALRTKFSKNDSFNQLFTNVYRTLVEAQDHQNYPFDSLIENLKIERTLNRSVLFDVMVTLSGEFDKHKESTQIKDLVVERIHDEPISVSKFDLTFNFGLDNDCLVLNLEFNSDLFERDCAEVFVNHFETLIENIVNDRDKPISLVELLSSNEGNRLHILSKSSSGSENRSSIVNIFENQVKLTPDSEALIFGAKKYTYNELNCLANRFARYILSMHKIQIEEIIGMQLQRNEWLIISMLAILKTGGAYLPMDIEYPEIRLNNMIKDCSCKIVIDQDFIDRFLLEKESYSSEDLRINITHHNLAYIIYTSGSTGTPKGVMIEQKSIINLVKKTNYINLDEKSILLMTGSISFDASTFEIWGMLLNGGTLIITSKHDLLEVGRLKTLINTNEVNIMWFTSTWFNQLVDIDSGIFKSLKTILVGGDRLSSVHINKVQESNQSLQILNGYGPTENTTFSLIYEIKNVEHNIPIGKPISNNVVYVLDGEKKLCPVGIVGEIYVGGLGIGRGYINNKELTKEKFINDPFDTNEQLYKTGDLGMWLPSEEIAFMGRLDDQIKINGNRVEIQEIESIINKFNNILSCVVINSLDKNGQVFLVAYYKSNDDINNFDIKQHLSKYLPNFMIPSFFIKLDEIPLTINGKVDKEKLPNYNEIIYQTVKEEVRNLVDQEILMIWRDVLDIDISNIGIYDNFFELGGNSIKIMKMVDLLNKQFDLKISIVTAFQHPNIASLSDYISKGNMDNQNNEEETSEVLNETLTIINSRGNE
jgi:amino acid adenylation domain-containing protein